jgi:hypothetical protein
MKNVDGQACSLYKEFKRIWCSLVKLFVQSIFGKIIQSVPFLHVLNDSWIKNNPSALLVFLHLVWYSCTHQQLVSSFIVAILVLNLSNRP